VAKNPQGKCVVYGTQPVIWGGAGGTDANLFVAASEAPITIEPGYYDYLLNPQYRLYYFYGVGYYPYNTFPYNNGYYSNVIVSSANLPAPVYVVVAAAADALNAPRGYIYYLVANGESLDQVTDHFGVNNATFLNAFYTQLDARIAETRANGTLQEWQAAVLRTNTRSPWLITTQWLLRTLAEYQ
jgi:hypothetical protein